MGSRRARLALQSKLDMLKEGEHYNEDLKPAVGERTLLPNPDPKEGNVTESRRQLMDLGIGKTMRRDAMIDYSNPREQLSAFSKYVDEVPPFDQGPLSIFRPYDFSARQQVNQVIRGRVNWAKEETKYDETMQSAQERLKEAEKNNGMAKDGDPAPTPAVEHALRRASYMESTQSL